MLPAGTEYLPVLRAKALELRILADTGQEKTNTEIGTMILDEILTASVSVNVQTGEYSLGHLSPLSRSLMPAAFHR